MAQPPSSRDEAMKIAGEFFSAVPQQSFGPSTLRDDVTWSAEFFDDGAAEGIEAVNAALKTHLSAFPDLELAISEEGIPAVFENGTLAVEVTIKGTNTGNLPGVGTTNRSIEGRGMAFLRFDDAGQIAEVRTYWDWGALLAQLGMRSFARPGPS